MTNHPINAGTWPDALPAVQVRMARPTAQLEAIVHFYGTVLGLPQLYAGETDGWTVAMFGLPGDQYNLEFVAHETSIDGRAPTAENLLVLYFATPTERDMVADRLRRADVPGVELDNPWWARHGAVAFVDPDDWRIVLMPAPVPL